MLNSLYGIHPDDLCRFLGEYHPEYRCRQLLSWIYRKFVFDPVRMTNLPAGFKDLLQQSFDLSLPQMVQHLVSSDGSFKLRLSLAAKAEIETVLMPEARKCTLCVSSQVGCAHNCSFCATGSMGLRRNLETHEIVQQILLAASLSDKPITNLVFMGMGEPMDNLETVLDALRLIQHEHSLAFSPRRTTVSTCGIVPGILRLADSGIKTKLAVSLNSALDEVRSQIMPVNRNYALAALKQALLYYQRRSRFRITLEYIMIPGLNMGATDVKALRKFCGDLSCKINFIPLNPVPKFTHQAPTEDEIRAFIAMAQSIPQAITLRRSRALDILGACGQLVCESQHKANKR